MTGRGARVTEAAGGPARHVPVLRREVIDALAIKPGGIYCDGTFGAGGYTRAILEAGPDVRVLGIDRDPTAIAAGQALVSEFGERLTLVQGRFGDLDSIAEDAGLSPLDSIVLDIGVSSMQIDDPERGFSFRFDGPLDMRMSMEGESAADIVNTMEEGALADLIYLYGEERRSRGVAKAIVAARKLAPITTTKQLADIVGTVVWAKKDEIHPATRTFQALRIAVNDELGELERALEAAEAVLAPGGRLAIVTFHSLEDRIVKRFMTERTGREAAPSRHAPAVATRQPTFDTVSRKPIIAGDAELAANPRARSAKLRVVERTAAPVTSQEPETGRGGSRKGGRR